ncbi:hypothetical protein AB1207_04230 [Kineococcus endophyticus]|uniref:Uncharacterized protein n=1 Tax=Kineococcus endophyticus TaxID=1181883 RepID=A0ABV3P2T3_9ACTN
MTVSGSQSGRDDEWQRQQEERARRESERRRLSPFRLTTEMCHHVCAAALVEYRSAPSRGSANGPGTYAYQGGLSELTDQLEDVGYLRDDVLNLPVFINEDLGRAMLFTSGDELTGTIVQGQAPSTKYPKGGVTHRLIQGNRRPGQDVLGSSVSFEALRPDHERRSEEISQLLEKLQVYVYLMHFDLQTMQIRHEISLPRPRQGDGYVKSWLERNLISAYPIGPEEIRGGETEINFPVDPL